MKKRRRIYSESLALRWKEFTLCEQLGHIGCEVGRSIKPENREAAAERACARPSIERPMAEPPERAAFFLVG